MEFYLDLSVATLIILIYTLHTYYPSYLCQVEIRME